MLHRTREKHELKAILLVAAVEVTEEPFAVVEGAIFFAIGSQMCVQGLYLETGVQDSSA